jgi:transitional endoplasmic reticulum ATPase
MSDYQWIPWPKEIAVSDEKPSKDKFKDVVVEVALDNIIRLPKGMSHEEAMRWLERDLERQNETIVIERKLNGFVYDGAYAFGRAIDQLFGFRVNANKAMGSNVIQIDNGRGQTVAVPWGDFEVPSVRGVLSTAYYNSRDGAVSFRAIARVLRKHEGQITALFDLTEKFLKEESLYKGRAIQLAFRDSAGHELSSFVSPTFMHPNVQPEDIIFGEETKQEIEDYVFGPIIHHEGAKAVGVPTKRGILLEGPYGVGKTMVGAALATIAERHGFTFIHLQDARRYGPAIVWTEDIEQAVVAERTDAVNQILNIIDGIESKKHQLMIVMTTNHVELINKAMLRPGRLDAVIRILPPTALAAIQLVRLYGRGRIPVNANLVKVGEVLAGLIPAVIREVVERAKLSALTRTNGKPEFDLQAPDLLVAAKSMKKQAEITSATIKAKPISVELRVNGVGHHGIVLSDKDLGEGSIETTLEEVDELEVD